MKVLYFVRLLDVERKRRPVLHLIRERSSHQSHACLEALARVKVTNCGVSEWAVLATVEKARHAQDKAGVDVRLELFEVLRLFPVFQARDLVFPKRGDLIERHPVVDDDGSPGLNLLDRPWRQDRGRGHLFDGIGGSGKGLHFFDDLWAERAEAPVFGGFYCCF